MLEDLRAGQVPLDPFQTAGAEDAAHPAAHLRTDTSSATILLGHQHALDRPAVGELREALVDLLDLGHDFRIVVARRDAHQDDRRAGRFGAAECHNRFHPIGDVGDLDGFLPVRIAAVAIDLSERVAGDAMRRVMEGQELERKRLARELHDETGQALTSILLGLRTIEEAVADRPEARESVLGLRELVVGTLQDVRRLAVQLRPKALDDFGLAPALRGTQLAPQDALREGGRGTAGARSHAFQHWLIVLETALAVALLTSGGLLLQTLQHLRNTDLGIRSEKLLTFETPLFRYQDLDKRVAYVNALLEQIRAIPGVINAGAISRVPLTVTDQSRFYLLAGQSRDRIPDQVALSRVVTRDYFSTIGARLREGRFFEISDRRSESPVAIVNESFADRHFPGRSPLGAQLKFERLNEKGYWYTIAGVVKEIRDRGVTEELKPAIYRLHEQADHGTPPPGGIVVRTGVEPATILPAVRQAIWSVDKNQPIWRVQTLEEIVDRQLSTPTHSTTLMSTFALLALLLASLGLYGVLSYAVTQRTNEIGVRMALGATSSEILLSFGKRGLVLTLAGLAIGLVLAAIAARLMTALLYGFRPDYFPTVTLVSLILLAVAALACFVPARRASRVDPVIALRNE